MRYGGPAIGATDSAALGLYPRDVGKAQSPGVVALALQHGELTMHWLWCTIGDGFSDRTMCAEETAFSGIGMPNEALRDVFAVREIEQG